jgi:hypothetical protein
MGELSPNPPRLTDWRGAGCGRAPLGDGRAADTSRAAIAGNLSQKNRSKNVIATSIRAGRVTLEDVTAGSRRRIGSRRDYAPRMRMFLNTEFLLLRNNS